MFASTLDAPRPAAFRARLLRVEELVHALALGLVAVGVRAVDDALVVDVAERLDAVVDDLMDRGWPTGHVLCAARVVNDLRVPDISWSGATLRSRTASLRDAGDAGALLAGLDPALREVAVLATWSMGRA